MPRLPCLSLALVLAVCLAGVAPVHAQDYKQAPPAEELDQRADEYVLGRRIVAILLIGGTLVGGMIGSISRRRERRRLAEEEARRSEDASTTQDSDPSEDTSAR